jgi:UDP-2,4-diacetamido-2,4,6-trideoxy-beta-L-altropyranose hydrolase
LKSIQLDWLIVDHYAIDEEWQKILSVYCKKLMVIDDLADRKHQCDILLDQTFGRKEQDYQNLVPNHCELLLGSQYILLRPEFAKWRQYSLSRRRKPEFRKLLIAMGGVDANNVTGQVLEALINCNLPVGIDVTIVLGDTAPHLKSVEQQVKIMPYKTQLKSNINNMAEIMANSDLAIGATGSTTWERCCLGLPTIQMVLANNQKLIAEVMYKIKGAIKLNIQDVGVLCSSISQAKNKLEALSHNSAQVTNGKGVFNVIDFILWK